MLGFNKSFMFANEPNFIYVSRDKVLKYFYAPRTHSSLLHHGLLILIWEERQVYICINIYRHSLL